jgi:hypothetical protein
MYLQKVTSRKNCVNNFFVVGILKVNDENSRIWIQDLDPGSGSGSISQRHGSADRDPDGSGTLLTKYGSGSLFFS